MIILTPDTFQLAQQQQRAGAGAGAGAGLGAGLGAGAGAGAGGQLDLGAALGNNPQMAGLRQAVEQNPALIQPIIQQLGQSNPALAQHLANNPDLLLQILGGLGGGGEGPDDGEGGPGTQVISVTEEERAAIGRVSARVHL
jgi:UV excision repair protein RAD23